MNRKITKTMAKAASDKMKAKAYGAQIDDIQAKLNVATEKLVRKYIPSPVIACVNEYRSCFDVVKYACISTIIEKNGYRTRQVSIVGKLSFLIPSASKYINVDRTDYDELRVVYKKLNLLRNEKDAFGEQVYNALVALGTEKKVQSELPEAIKYICFPEKKELPSPIFTGLRGVIANIKDE